MQKILTGIILCVGLTACAGPLTQFNFNATELQRVPDFTHQNLVDQKIGILSATGGDGYRRVLADSFSKALSTVRPEIPQLTPQKAIGLLNRANLADEYTNMIRDYETSGVLRKESLSRIGEALGVGYLIQLSLLQYTQDTSTRFSFLGIRFLETRSSTLRVFAQIWDVRSGEIVWEASSEVTLAGEDVREKPIAFEEVATRAWQELIKQLI
ncbi:MAG: hypothetical protein HY203_07590 [Nitrospirae bacterium]|nr:hypothetical protein [Nitrospirota bacterium]